MKEPTVTWDQPFLTLAQEDAHFTLGADMTNVWDFRFSLVASKQIVARGQCRPLEPVRLCTAAHGYGQFLLEISSGEEKVVSSIWKVVMPFHQELRLRRACPPKERVWRADRPGAPWVEAMAQEAQEPPLTLKREK